MNFLLVSRSYWKIQISSHVITFRKKSGSFLMFSRVSVQQFTRCSFCSGVRIFGTTLTHTILMPKSSCKMCLTLYLLMLRSSEIARMLSRLSPRRILATFSTFPWVFAVEGRPDFGSSPTYSLPSLNFLNHSKTCVRDRHWSPYTSVNKL